VEKCSETNLISTLAKKVFGFEESIHIGAKTIWPELRIVECRFNSTQT
jgi:hypothetical protein